MCETHATKSAPHPDSLPATSSAAQACRPAPEHKAEHKAEGATPLPLAAGPVQARHATGGCQGTRVGPPRPWAQASAQGCFDQMKHGASESSQAQCSHLFSVFPSVRLTRGEHFRRGTQHWAFHLIHELSWQVTYTPCSYVECKAGVP